MFACSFAFFVFVCVPVFPFPSRRANAGSTFSVMNFPTLRGPTYVICVRRFVCLRALALHACVQAIKSEVLTDSGSTWSSAVSTISVSFIVMTCTFVRFCFSLFFFLCRLAGFTTGACDGASDVEVPGRVVLRGRGAPCVERARAQTVVVWRSPPRFVVASALGSPPLLEGLRSWSLGGAWIGDQGGPGDRGGPRFGISARARGGLRPPLGRPVGAVATASPVVPALSYCRRTNC